LHFLWRIENTLHEQSLNTIRRKAWQLAGWGRNMPLKKSASPAAFRANVKAEVKAGKPIRQAVAIAYSVKRNAKTNK
jgi:hypothetical protein